MPIDRRNLVLFASVFASQGLAATAFAQDWPSKFIVIIVPFPLGGSADLSARFLAERLKTAFGQPVVVEHKTGAGGNLAAAEAARAEANGYTLLIGTNGIIHWHQRNSLNSLAPTELRPSIKVSIGTCLTTRRPTLPRLR